MEKLNLTDEEIKEILDGNFTWNELGKRFSVHPDKIRYFFKIRNLKKPISNKVENYENLSDNDKTYIIDNFSNYSLSYFVRKFDLSEKLIKRFCIEHNLDYKNKPRLVTPFLLESRSWSPEDTKYLKENFGKPLEELSIILKRPKKSIAKKIWEMDLPSQGHSSQNWSEYEDRFLRRHYHKPYSYCSFFLERTEKAIIHRINFLNLKRERPEFTNIELIVKNILDKNNINYQFNSRISNKAQFRPDFFLSEKNLIIECYGDYWHCNPELVLVLTDIQEIKVEKDAEKESFYRNEGFNLEVFWESTILLDNFEDILLNKLNQYA